MIDLNVKLVGKLSVDGFNPLTHPIMEMARFRRDWCFLVGTREGMQVDAVGVSQSGSHRGTDESLVAITSKSVCCASISSPTVRSLPLAGARIKSTITPLTVTKRCSL